MDIFLKLVFIVFLDYFLIFVFINAWMLKAMVAECVKVLHTLTFSTLADPNPGLEGANWFCFGPTKRISTSLL